MGVQLRNEGDAGVKAMRDIRNSHKGVLKRKRPEALESADKAAEAEQEAAAQHDDEEEDGQHEDHQDDHQDSDDDMDVAPPQADAGRRAAGACNHFLEFPGGNGVGL